MATHAGALLFGTGCHHLSLVGLEHRPQSVTVRRKVHGFCNMRHRNPGSSSRKRHQNKKTSERLTLNKNLQCQGDGREEVKLTSLEDLMSPSQYKIPEANPSENLPIKADDIPSSVAESIDGLALQQIENSSKQLLPTGQLEDLTQMIKQAEENVLLLNHARITAVNELEHTLSEKEGLQAEINALELKLAEIDARVKDAAQEKIHVEFLEPDLERLKNKIYRDRSEGSMSFSDCSTQSDIYVIVEELNALKVENSLLKDDIKALNEKFEASLEKSNGQLYNDVLLHKVEMLEERLQIADQEIHSCTILYQKSQKEFKNAIEKLKEHSEKVLEEHVDDISMGSWSRLLLMVDSWLIEKKISSKDGNLLREMVQKKDPQIYEAYLTCSGKNEHDAIEIFLKLTQPQMSKGLHIVHIAAEMAPAAKVGGLGDVVSGLSKALQRKGHLVEIVLPKYDCLQYDQISGLKALDVAVESYFDGQLFKNIIWVGIVEGLPVFFIEPQHPSMFFHRGSFYGEHDDFKRFSFFSRAALELLYQAGKKPDIIHCHDWQTAFVAPLYWDIYAAKGFNSSRICFTCHNFEYQGAAHVSELSSCGLDIQRLHRPDRMQDNLAFDRINPLKGAIVFSNIVTTVSPTYAQDVLTPECGRGLHGTLTIHSKKYVGVLNGVDTDSWNPSTDKVLPVQYSADDLQGKAENKDALRRHLGLSSQKAFQPLICSITRLVPQKGVHLIRRALYQTIELGGQFVLLGSSPIPHIQREFEDLASHFKNHPDVRLLLKYDEALSRMIYAASDMFIIPSLFEPCGLTQMIAMRYGSVPIVRRTGGLNDSVFDIDDETIPVQFRNGFSFSRPDEQDLNNAMKRAFDYYTRNPENWRKLVQTIMRLDFSWNSSAQQYEELYEKAVIKARAAANLAPVL